MDRVRLARLQALALAMDALIAQARGSPDVAVEVKGLVFVRERLALAITALEAYMSLPGCGSGPGPPEDK